MAWLSEAQMAQAILQYIRRLPVGQVPPPEDQALVVQVIEGDYDELNKLELLPFTLTPGSPTTVFPPWCQQSLIQFIADDVKPFFGIAVERDPRDGYTTGQKQALRRLSQQISGRKQYRQVISDYF